MTPPATPNTGDHVSGQSRIHTARSFRTQLPIVFAVRTAVNAPVRIIYPFLPSIARGLGISLAAASQLVTLRMVAGLAAPLLGLLADGDYSADAAQA